MKVVKFGAVWCSGCLVMKPRWDKIHEKLPWLEGKYYDYDMDTEEVKKYEVNGGKLPCFVFQDKQGEEITRLTGEVGEDNLIKLCEKLKDK